MAVRANPDLVHDLQRFGADDVSRCYHCGNCTAACQLVQQPFLFPRKSMRALQLGLEARLRASLEPWLCYYCGDCTEQCPRGADPGETMMSMRRWLTGQYDFTGLASLFYRSPATQLAVMGVLALLTGAGFLAYGYAHGGALSVYDGPGALMPERAIHLFDWWMGGTLFALLGVNVVRMWAFSMRGEAGVRAPLSAYLKNLLLLPFHFLTQRRYSHCKSRRPWAIHLALMLGYATMLVLIVFFLPLMQQGPEIRWEVHAFGYLAAIALLVGGILALRGRLEKEMPHHRRTHGSDWIFIGGIVFLTVTGVVQHLLHRAGLPAAANVAYLIHLMGVASFEITQVPFGKWSHLAYRPLAMYFAAVQAAARSEAAPALEKPQPAIAAAH
jgi:ferredoxin